MKGRPTLLSLAVGLALASPSLHAAGFSCPADSALTPIPDPSPTGKGDVGQVQ